MLEVYIGGESRNDCLSRLALLQDAMLFKRLNLSSALQFLGFQKSALDLKARRLMLYPRKTMANQGKPCAQSWLSIVSEYGIMVHGTNLDDSG